MFLEHVWPNLQLSKQFAAVSSRRFQEGLYSWSISVVACSVVFSQGYVKPCGFCLLHVLLICIQHACDLGSSCTCSLPNCKQESHISSSLAVQTGWPVSSPRSGMPRARKRSAARSRSWSKSMVFRRIGCKGM